MRFASLGSGSKGNATLVEWRNTCILIDCGFSIRETVRRLNRLGKTADDIDAILVTHEHGDHLRGVLPLAKKFALRVIMTNGTTKAVKGDLPDTLEWIDHYDEFYVGDLSVTPVAVPHDAREPVQFVFKSDRHTLGLLTDLGSITPHVVEQYRYCDGLLLESNHDTAMLSQGPYPPSVKSRVAGDWGHLNNQQALGLLQRVELKQMQQLVLGHISQQNNSLALVKEVMTEIEQQVASVHYACQEQGFDWVELS